MLFKTCRGCAVLKAITDFRQHSQMADGHLNFCKACVSRRDAEYRVKNKESLKLKSAVKRARTKDQIKDRDAAYRARTIDQRRAYDREYYQRNRERLLAYQDEYNARHSDKIRERLSDYRVHNRERLRAWHRDYRINNPDMLAWRYRIKSAIRQAQKKATAIVKFSPEDLQDKFSYWNNSCWVCGEPATAVDHVKPLSAGGAHMLCNLRPICRSCNSAKNDKWPLPSRASIMGII
jgi:5-methylcytosine-specific restriction endonuclease McrA